MVVVPEPLDSLEGTYTSISGGSGMLCAVSEAGSVRCGGFEAVDPPPEAGPFTKVAAGQVHACGIRTDQTMACWGHNYEPPTSIPTPY